MPGLLWIFFLCFFMCLLLLVSALAGVTIGTTSAVAHMDSVKSLIANLLMLPLLLGRIKRDRHPSAAGGRRQGRRDSKSVRFDCEIAMAAIVTAAPRLGFCIHLRNSR
jgi:hypothetical protein